MKTRTCPTCRTDVTGWEAFLIHIYEEHTEGTGAERMEQVGDILTRPPKAPRWPCPVGPCPGGAENLPHLTQHIYERHTEDGDEANGGNSRWEITERLLGQAVDTEATGTPQPLREVRRDCAFCGRERTPKDDNHAPGCTYWDFFGTPS